MKSKTLLITMLTCMAMLSACGGVTEQPQDNEISNVEQSIEEQKEAKKETFEISDVTIDEKVLLDEQDIKITAKSLTLANDFDNMKLKLLIENNSDKDITIQARDENINDIMIEGVMSCDVTKGKKANDTLDFMSWDLEKKGIKTIKDIEFSFHIFDMNSGDVILDSTKTKITTSADKNFKQSYDTKGSIALDSNGIKLVCKELKKDDYGDVKLMVYVENNSENDVIIQTRDVSVNGFMISPIFSCEVSSGKKSYDYIKFSESDLADNDIEKISKIQMSLHIYDGKNSNTILDTQPIDITF